MENYIKLLIEDLHEAKSKAPASLEFSDVYEEFEKQMLAIENAPDKSYDALMGITYQQFPPSAMLNEEQVSSLVFAIENTFESFNICVDLPESVPLTLKYELIRELFREKIHYMPGFTNHFDFCSGYCPECKVGDYCKNRIMDYSTLSEFK